MTQNSSEATLPETILPLKYELWEEPDFYSSKPHLTPSEKADLYVKRVELYHLEVNEQYRRFAPGQRTTWLKLKRLKESQAPKTDKEKREQKERKLVFQQKARRDMMLQRRRNGGQVYYVNKDELVALTVLCLDYIKSKATCTEV